MGKWGRWGRGGLRCGGFGERREGGNVGKLGKG